MPAIRGCYNKIKELPSFAAQARTNVAPIADQRLSSVNASFLRAVRQQRIDRLLEQSTGRLGSWYLSDERGIGDRSTRF